MCPVRYVKPKFPADAFVGTAVHYSKYRLPYPESLNKDLLERAGVSGEGKLLDLACGPGRVALPLASSFGEVWAVDLEPEMIGVGKTEAKKKGIDNVKWSVGKAEDLQAEPASFHFTRRAKATPPAPLSCSLSIHPCRNHRHARPDLSLHLPPA